MKIKNVLNEKLTKVTADVEMIYRLSFEAAFKKIAETGEANVGDLRNEVFSSARLTSKKARMAHAINPISIYAADPRNTGNSYSPGMSKITVDIHRSAWGLAVQFHSIENAANNLNPSIADRFRREFVPETIKGSIHHELAHWIDDSLNNGHINKHVELARDKGVSPQDNTGYLERNSQIHNIVQLKRILNKKWDALSFEEMVQYIPSMGSWSLDLAPEEHKKWKRLLLRRMAREGLVGRMMRS